MGGLFSSEPVAPLLSKSNENNIATVFTKRYNSITFNKPSMPVFERDHIALDTVYERETVESIPEPASPHEIPEPSEPTPIVYYHTTLEQVEEISKREFYDIKRVDLSQTMVTDDIILRRHRAPRKKSKDIAHGKPPSSHTA